MGYGAKDEENPVSEDETEAEKQKLRTPEMGDDVELKKIPVKVRDAAYPEVIIGNSDPLLKVHHLKYLLIGFNGFLTTLGLVLLSLSIWIYADAEYTQLETKLNVDNFKTVCILFIVASLIVIFVGFLGCFAAVTERRWLLIAFIGIFGIIFVVEIGAVVLMWSAPYSKTITRELEKQIKLQIDSRPIDDSARYFTDFIQSHLQCCGSLSPKDYGENDVPNSCDSEVNGLAYQEGCAAKMLSYLRSKAGIVGGIALPILLLQLLALMAAGCLIKSLDVESKYFM
ncbi:23 kDa integral membrane protein [Parasteatoda tepidariorum]|uniref:Tetraspanin n=1 Tax=Parasteatoda tepidariorum TaxID=114398 RepID=A0A2L2Y2M2_PARTP|nr:23 kDa integral membrane protein [Parasteatoda tepidariorum]